MNSNDYYRLFDLDYPDEMENIIKDIVYTLDNYEFLKSRLPKCKCEESLLIVEGICASCGGVEVKTKYIMKWRW